MKIGDYVKFDNKLWEIIRILSRKEQTCDMFPNGLPDYYLLNCVSQDLPQQWIGADVVEETNISQLYFEL